MVTRCFLDTTYLMPFFGLDVSIDKLYEQLSQVIRNANYHFLYSPVSIIEIKWQVIKLGRSGCDIDELELRFSQAITSLKSNSQWELVDFVDASINDLSFELRKLGHDDYFDTIIASTALWKADLLVTEDGPLKKVIQSYFTKIGNQGDVKPIGLHDWKGFFKLQARSGK
ncbi:MAG: hypothetical protein ACTSXU_06560 [Promethearchaeota archaeon]